MFNYIAFFFEDILWNNNTELKKNFCKIKLGAYIVLLRYEPKFDC